LLLASMVESVRGLIGGGLPCDGYQRFESAYLQLVNLADTKLYDSTQFFRVKFDSIRYSFRFDSNIPDIRKPSNQSKY
ncbi:hypothetical protein BRARA_B02035, partial [Brassica rapa]